MNVKESFQKTDAAKAFAQFASTKAFEEALNAAMLTLVNDQSPNNDSHTAMANGFRTEGARMFVNKLMALIKPPAGAPSRSVGELNYNQK